MFVVGLELDLDGLRGRAHTAVAVSHASILVPCFLGVTLSLALYRRFAPAGVRFVPFALFLGIAMSITAFPVLARILEERGLSRTPLGSAAITCAAVDDITAWSLLAVVVAIAKAQGLASSGFVVLMSAAFVAFMWYVVGPAVRRIIGRSASDKPSKNVLAFVLLLLIGSALTTERIGIHALFGAFLIGVVMPQGARLPGRDPWSVSKRSAPSSSCLSSSRLPACVRRSACSRNAPELAGVCAGDYRGGDDREVRRKRMARTLLGDE